ncbi:carbohydrate kinase family protein [Rugosimonospora africana]|uniref:Carbohydrate kinase n=1 Tax=Rugosimonospora africana TaxID=556532 RepID=A0A8J3VVD5_9ACTN|nr:PfkB family carbohydrate kinase [Rugosimonospora africana]GIH20170.1 carbohydrate kinase [Rugosimonospora africana]
MTSNGGELDLFVSGAVFLDIIFTGLREMPAPGTEAWAPGMGSCPGGIANLAVAAGRLGVRTGLSTAFSTDAYGDFCWQILSRQEGLDLSSSRRFDNWHTPVTVSLAYDRDRCMITHGHPVPVNPTGLVAGLPAARAASVSLTTQRPAWLRKARDAGTLVFADVGWDDSAAWPATALEVLDDCHAFLPNAAEAMQYTRTDTPRDALRRLADRVPVAVVTCGSDGALAVDSGTGAEVSVPAVPVEALDPTGAGDVFTAGFIAGTLWELPLSQRLAFATLVAALSVQHFGGSLSAPGWGDITDWWSTTHTRATRHHKESSEAALAARYGFLDDLIPVEVRQAPRRAPATITRLPDAA